MSVVARIKTLSQELDAGPVATRSEWADFKIAVLAFSNISELVTLTQQGKADDGIALRDDLEAILATFELPESLTLIAQTLLKIALRMQPDDVLFVVAE